VPESRTSCRPGSRQPGSIRNKISLVLLTRRLTMHLYIVKSLVLIAAINRADPRSFPFCRTEGPRPEPAPTSNKDETDHRCNRLEEMAE
jgi:hypothetical protein